MIFESMKWYSKSKLFLNEVTKRPSSQLRERLRNFKDKQKQD